jgi:16S rRNA (uracil1498-N3)-methyltransferase
LSGGQRLVLPPEPSKHLVQVLRLRAGDALALFDGGGRDYPALLVEARQGAALVAVGPPGEEEPVPGLAVHLGIGVSKGERMDFALQKAVELGVSAVTPLFTERSVVRLDGDRLARRQQHWRGVMIAACEQSGRRRLPELEPATGLDAWLRLRHPCPLLLDHRSPTALPDLPPPNGALTLLVGPEGGLAPAERATAARLGFTGVCLGPRILRAETAPLAALAAIQALWGDFRA